MNKVSKDLETSSQVTDNKLKFHKLLLEVDQQFTFFSKVGAKLSGKLEGVAPSVAEPP